MTNASEVASIEKATTEKLNTLPSPLLTQIQAVLRRDPKADNIAIFWEGALAHTLYCGELEATAIKLVYCVSELAMREALVARLGEADGRLVLVAPFAVTELGQDVLARLWRNEPQRINPWRTLEQLTRVGSIDPRLPKRYGKWMADALLHGYKHYEKTLHFGDVLDRESAWQALALAYLGFNQPHSDLASIFRWSMAHQVPHAIGKQGNTALPKDMQAHISDWLSPSLNGLAPLVGHLVLNQPVEDLLAIGLACSVIYYPKIVEQGLLSYEQQLAAKIKFKERQLQGLEFSNAVLAEFGEKAAQFTGDLILNTPEEYQHIKHAITKAEQLLASFDASAASLCSAILPAGFRLRLMAFGKALQQAIKKGTAPQQAHLAFNSLEAHALATLAAQREQVERARMALRLVYWLNKAEPSNTKASPSVDANQLLNRYLDHGGFVDWARTQIWFGDPEDNLSQVYQSLAAKVAEKRETENFSFSQALEPIAKGSPLNKRFVYVEQTLEAIVAPLAEQTPVLLLILDGMSQAVYRELAQDFSHHHWVELQPEAIGVSQALVATLPSITQVSRYALLAGELGSGLAPEEATRFKQHPLLKRLAASKFPPTVFHKQDLQQPGSGSLNTQVRGKIAGTEHKILAAVINAVDDQLKSSSQVACQWRLHTIRPLKQILEAAREAERVVIVTSDHGHILEHETAFYDAGGDAGERYRGETRALQETEVLLQGTRVVNKHNRGVFPWSETLRYTKNKNMGYHGGASLQEMAIPLGVFTSAGAQTHLAGWQEVPLYQPSWWALETATTDDGLTKPASDFKKELRATKKASKRKTADTRTADLFAAPAQAEQTAAEDWVEQLFTSPVYKDARARLGRIPVTDAEIHTFLRLLQDNGGQVMQAVVVRELKKPEMRMRGFLSALQRILNVEGYPILKVERETHTILLDVRALKTQFEL